MEHPTLVVALLAAFLATTGCNTSVKLDPEPPAAPVVEQSAPVAENKQPEKVCADKPVDNSPRSGYYGAVAGGYRSAREQIEALPITQAIQFYHASEGRYPKSHEEFMEKVIKFNQMQLPEVEEGYRLEYDPTDHTVYKVLIEEEAPTEE